MNRLPSFPLFALAVVSLMSNAASITDLKAVCRHGQVFLTWNEKELPDDATLSVYSSSLPITAETISTAKLLATDILPSSARDWLKDPASFKKDAPHGEPVGFIIEPGGEPLNPISGLHVHTVSTQTEGERYFAVLWKSRGLPQSPVIAGENATLEPCQAVVGQPIPIWQGTAETEPQANSCEGRPLILDLHGRGGGDTSNPHSTFNSLWFANAQQGWREGLPFKFQMNVHPDKVVFFVQDRVWVNRPVTESKDARDHCPAINTFWCGYNVNIAHNTGGGKTVVVDNFTEKYLLGLIDYAQNYLGTDPNRTYVMGSSMGGSASVAMATHFPDRIAAVYAQVPVYSYTWEKCSTSNAITACRLECSCGPLKGKNATLKNGMDLFEYMNGAKNITVTKDIPPIFATNGRSDPSIPWVNNPPFYAAANQAQQAFAVFWNNGNHSMSSQAPNDVKFWSKLYLKYRLDLSYPAFSNNSDNKNYGNGAPEDGDLVGWINRGLDWNVVSDTPNRYEITITAKHPDIVYPVTLDMTIRRRQQFKPLSGEQLIISINGVERPATTMPQDGLLTISRLVIPSAEPLTVVIRK
ncbi:MAG: prolyl oligopeptidase family serine peptidase [Victivallales bacterium]|nr:prolyl oligopeptidase family serine peptidase [Victivallales bacterium]